MNSYRSVGVALLLCVACVSGCRPQSTERSSVNPAPTIRLLHTWGIDASATAQMRSALARSLPDMHVELNRPGASATALIALQKGQVDAVFTFASVAYLAVNGQLPGMAEPFDDLRALAELPSRTVEVVVGPHSGITSIAELRGRHLSIGPPGSSSTLMAELLLRAFGISLGDVKIERFELGDATAKLISGEIDALFSNGYPNSDVAEATRRGARILEIVGAEVDQFRARYPLLKPTVIPAGTYPLIDRTVHTVGVDGILLCRSELDERIAHELTRAIVEIVARRKVDIEPLKHMNLSAASSTAIPLHPGAARYYRERELLP